VVDSVAVHQSVSICGDNPDAPPSYAGLMSQVGTLMGSQLVGGCLFAPPVNPAAPTCTVTATGSDGVKKSVLGCASGAMPCWTVESDNRCPTERDPATDDVEQLRLVLRGQVDASATVQASCRVYSPAAP